jgi:hypothetical protein
MPNVQVPLDVKICRKCAVEPGIKKLENPQTCTRHPAPEDDESTSRLSEYEHYLYDELPAGNTIRLVQLAPGHDDEPLECNLVVRSLDSDLPYTALSHTWGDPVPEHTTSCNGSRFVIGGNLHSGLLQFRRDDRMEPL